MSHTKQAKPTAAVVVVQCVLYPSMEIRGALEKIPGSMGKRIADFCRSDSGVLILVAAARFALHLATNAQYGFHRDERDLNATVQSFPSNILAGMFGFQQRQYFEAAAVDREPVEVKF